MNEKNGNGERKVLYSLINFFSAEENQTDKIKKYNEVSFLNSLRNFVII